MDTLMIGGICRCCASEGPSKDLTSRYSWMGDEEIYSKMLLDCFDISLYMDNEGNNGGICEVCITQLRNAFQFKKQVQLTEDKFKKTIRCGTVTAIKLEVVREDCSDSEQDMQEEHLDDNSATEDFEVPIKRESSEEVEEVVPKKRPRPSTSKAALKAEPNSSRPRLIPRRRGQIEQKKRGSAKNISGKGSGSQRGSKSLLPDLVSEHVKIKHNFRTILKYSNATPFKSKNVLGYDCAYCNDVTFGDPQGLRRHTHSLHTKDRLDYYSESTNKNYVLFVDILELICTVCFTHCDDIKDLQDHVIKKHDAPFYTDINDYIQPFKLTTDKSPCCLCPEVFEKFQQLVLHMNIHYPNFVCPSCGAGFVNKYRLKQHELTHVSKPAYKCIQCELVFDNPGRRRDHNATVHFARSGVHICHFDNCVKRFPTYYRKQQHLIEVHKFTANKCDRCSKSYTLKTALRKHIRRVHMNERAYGCEVCGVKFFEQFRLLQHMDIHKPQKDIQCEICNKMFKNLQYLRCHVRKFHGKKSDGFD